ncbi:MAG: SGNH/GDSL hydrolase family protein [Planctomycetota bacterium]|jgi:lysophospholipase L1-like esterase
MGIKSKRLIFKMVLIALSTAVTLFVCEYGFRFARNLRYEHEASEFSDAIYKIVPHSKVEYILHPNVQRESKISPHNDTKWTYTTNSKGYRGKDIPDKKDKDEIRIAFLGDSYTFGWAINDHETYPEQLKALLKNKYPDIPIETVNLAVPGYNTIQQSALVEEVSAYEPDILFLGYVMNDAEPFLGYVVNPNHAYRHAFSWLLEYVKLQINHYLFSDNPPFEVNILYPNRSYLDGFQSYSPKWKDSKEALGEIASFCTSRNIPLIVLIFPDFTENFDDSYSLKKIHDAVTSWCNEFNIDVIDLLPSFLGLDHRKYSIRLEGHPNAKAFKKVAEILAGPVESKVALLDR